MTMLEAPTPNSTQSETIYRVLRLDGSDDAQQLLTHEWLVANGLGGYASGTISGQATRRYHGLFISAQPAPLGRQLLLSHLMERVRLSDGTLIRLSGEDDRRPGHRYGTQFLSEFRLEFGLPVWRYEFNGVVIERQVIMPHEQNTVYVIYRLLQGAPLRLKLMPCLHNRSHDAHVSTPLPEHFDIHEYCGRYEFVSSPALPTLRMQVQGEQQAFTVERQTLPERLYPVEESRGYERAGVLWSPGYFRVNISETQPAVLIASTESWQVLTAMDAQTALHNEHERRLRCIQSAHPAARTGLGAELVLAADQFIIRPVGRTEDMACIQAKGDDVRTIIAGYHWFTDWGRDTMISLEGLTLATGRKAEAGYILRTFAHYIRDGLIPNHFPEGKDQGLYHTADASLWFFHAVDRYVDITGDLALLEFILPRLIDIAIHHVGGTRFGIGIDPEDALLRQGAAGYQLTWMDAKVGDWVVTPRRGKAVEINALWYNALCILANRLRESGNETEAARWSELAQRVYQSFNERFWNEHRGCLYDVVDDEAGGIDAACRPNQIFALSLRYPVLEERRWSTVLDVVASELLTPVGLRSLSKDHPDFRAQYSGDLRARDAAYHQGTVWGWLIGPFVDAWLRVHPEDPQAARRFLLGFDDHLNDACIGSISEVFDAEPPYTPRGCCAQAWSVAEVLRCWLRTS